MVSADLKPEPGLLLALYTLVQIWGGSDNFCGRQDLSGFGFGLRVKKTLIVLGGC